MHLYLDRMEDIDCTDVSLLIVPKSIICLSPWASFTKQGKLARECNSKTVPMGVEISAGDLLTTRKLKNTDAISHFHNDQRNLPSAAQLE